MTFRGAVWALVRRIPAGQVVTYGQVATLVGRARSARAVGGAMGRCPDDVPWHRVVNAQGGIARRRRQSGMLTQRIRLEQEGIRLRRGRVPLARYRWEPDMRSTRRADSGARTLRNGRRTPREPGGRGKRNAPPVANTCGWR
jgi:methylated-DNA-protein-cysteine methyltransferase related protein